jgi:tRNA A37 threonylcarbamoyladenosine modification protein TsaB
LYSLPILQVSSLSILGLQTKGPTLALVSAFRNLYYWAVVQGDAFLSSPTAQPLNEIAAQINKERPQGINVIGDIEGFELGIFPENCPFFQISPRADILGAYAARANKTLWTLDWKNVAPLYLRDSEAEEKIKKLKP